MDRRTILAFLLIGVIISLFSGLVFLFKDADRTDSRRTLHALGVRVTLAAALLGTMFYGFYTGQLRLGTNAPWHGTATQAAPVQATPTEASPD